MRRNFGFNNRGECTLSLGGPEKIKPNTRILHIANNNRDLKEQAFRAVIKTIRSLIGK